MALLEAMATPISTVDVPPMAVSLSVMFICRIALSYVIADFMGVGVFGTWIAMFIDWYVRAAFYVYRYFSGKWMEYRAVGSNIS